MKIGLYLALSFFILMIGTAFSQTGEVTGSIVDLETQRPLPGVNVIVQELSLGAASDEDGRYIISDLPPGTYNLVFRMMGYETLRKLNIPVSPGRQTILDVALIQTSIKMDRVVVRAQVFMKARDAVVSDQNVDFTELLRDPGSTMDVQRMMQALPSVVSGTDQQNEIIVRGGSPGENLFLLDNIEIPNPNHFGWQGTGGGPISFINPLFINSVDFYAGAFPARYGGKCSSVMDIQLKEGNRENFALDMDMSMAGLGLFAEGPVANGKASYMFGFHKSYLDLIINSFGMTAVPRYSNFQGKVVWYLTPRTKLIWNGIYGRDAINIEEEDIYSGPEERVKSNGYEYATGISLKSVFARDRYVYLTLSRVGNYWLYDVNKFRNGVKIRDLYDKDDLEQEWTLKGDYYFRISEKQDMTLGLNLKWIDDRFNTISASDTVWSYRYYHLVGNDTVFNYYHHWDYPWLIEPDGFLPDSVKMIYSAREITDDLISRKYSFYGQYKWKPVNKLAVTAGIRWSYFEYNKQSMLAPRLGVSYKLSQVTTLNFGYGRHFQEPVAFQLVYHPQNKYLKEKETEQTVIGLEHLFTEDTKGTLEIYRKTYSDLPVYRSWLEGDSLTDYRGEMVSEGKGYSQGVELFLQKKMTQNLHYTVSYSYYVSRFRDLRRENTYYPGDYDFRHVFTLVSGYRWQLYERDWYRRLKDFVWYKFTAWALPLGDEVEVSIRWRFTKGRPYTPPVYDPYYRSWFIPWSQSLNTKRYPDYRRLDFMLVRRFIFSSANLVTYLDVMNLFGRKNIWGYSYREDGTRSNIYQFSLFPVGGFTLEF